jgi:hypothetical protein
MARKAVEVTLSTGKVVVVKEPGAMEFQPFVRMIPGMMAVGQLSQAVREQAQSGVFVPIPEIPEAVLTQVYEFLAKVAGLTAEEYTELTISDTFGLIQAVSEVMSLENFTLSRSKLPSTATPPE